MDFKEKLTIISDDLNHDEITEQEARKKMHVLLDVSNLFIPGIKVEIFANYHGHQFEIGECVTLIERKGEQWFAENEKGERWYIDEEEANVC